MKTPLKMGKYLMKNELIAQEGKIRIPEGHYDAICIRSEYGPSFGGQKKLYLTFRIIDGEYTDVELVMYCNKPSTLKITHKLHKQWCYAIAGHPKPGERFNKNIFKNKAYKVLVTNAHGKLKDGTPEPDFMKYSKVDSIIEPIAGVKISE